MSLRVIGAGVGRTGTMSLKVALEKLLGAPCYHMVEVFAHPEHVSPWHAAARGEMPDWNALFEGYAAAVDWPAAAFTAELSALYPDALVLLSVRDPQAWWRSADQTIFRELRRRSRTEPPFMVEWQAMTNALMDSRFPDAIDHETSAITAFERHNAAVRNTIPAGRLLEWRAGDGWEPICAALGVPVPDEPFPRTNTREDWAVRRSAES